MAEQRGLEDEITVAEDDVTVKKRFEPTKHDIPTICISIQSHSAKPTSVTLIERIPESYPINKIAVHPDYEPEKWTKETKERLVYTRTLSPMAEARTVYGVQISTRREAQKFLQPPKLTVTHTGERTETGFSQQEDVLTRIKSRIDGYEFEHFIADLWERRGWNTEVTDSSKDSGIDIRASRDNVFFEKRLLQVKNFTDASVSGPKIQQYASLQYQEPNVDVVIVLTTSTFSGPAKDLAEDLNVKLVNGTDLEGLIDDIDAYDLVKAYTS